MGQVHKRFSDEQVAFPLQAYSQGLMTKVEVQEVLGIGKSRFFSLWPRPISIAVALDPRVIEEVRDGPTSEYYTEYNRVNCALNEIAGRTAELVLSLGYRAEPFPATVPETEQADNRPGP